MADDPLVRLMTQLRQESAALVHLMDQTAAGTVSAAELLAIVRQQAETPAPPGSVVPVQAAGVAGEWITAPGVAGGATLFYIHGGGWVRGSPAGYREFLVRLSAAAGARVFAPVYRLAPEAPFPAGLDDCVHAYRWLLTQGVDPRQLAILGDSAGGNLAMALTLRLREQHQPLPAALAILSAVLDLTLTSESHITRAAADPTFGGNGIGAWFAHQYLNGLDPRTPLASPVYADLAGLPPLLIQVGDAEVLLDDSVRLAERARAAGGDVTLEVWDAMPHVFQFYPELPEAGQALTHIRAFIQKHLTV